MSSSHQSNTSSQQKNDIVGQRIILFAMKFLGYENVNHGFCYGIATKKLEAIILGKTSVKDTEGNIHEIDQLEVYEKRIQKLLQIYEKYIQKHLQDEKLQNYLGFWRNASYLEGIQDFYHDKKQIILNEIQADIEKLPVDEQNKEKQAWVDIYAFLDGVALNQSGEKYSHLYEGDWAKPQNFMKSVDLTASLALEEKQGIAEVDTLLGCYDLAQLTDYFKILRESLETNNPNSNIGFNLLSKSHAICFGYDSYKHEWILGDPNHATDKPLALVNEDLTNNDLAMAKKIMSYLALKKEDALKDDDKIIFSTHVYMTGADNKKETSDFINHWRNSDEMQAMHALDHSNISKVDVLGNNLLGQAQLENNFKLASDIISIFPQDQLNKGLYSSLLRSKFNNVADFLKKGVDIENALQPLLDRPWAIPVIEKFIIKIEEEMARDADINLLYKPVIEQLRETAKKNRSEIDNTLTEYSLTLNQAKKLPAEVTGILFLKKYNNYQFALAKHPEHTQLILKAVSSSGKDIFLDDLIEFLSSPGGAISAHPILTQGIDLFKPGITTLDQLDSIMRSLSEEQAFEFLTTTLGIDFIKPLLLEAKDNNANLSVHWGPVNILESLPKAKRFTFLTENLGIEFVKLISENESRRQEILETLEENHSQLLEKLLNTTSDNTSIIKTGYAKFGVFGALTKKVEPAVDAELDPIKDLPSNNDKSPGL